MTDHTHNGIAAVVKALETVVLPAIDPTDPMAREQLRLAVDYLRFVDGRIDLAHDRARFELSEQVALGRSALDAGLRGLSHDDATRVELAVLLGEAALGDAVTGTTELWSCNAKIAAAVSESLRVIGANGADSRVTAVELAVVDASTRRLAMERSWYEPLGFDHEAASLPPVEDLVRTPRSAAT